ncbi:uncharacterized protein LOC124155522 isoform X2 [Ischnura elegans]|uniref:uncharacterized protein LOC124155522 isoform X2 n=1 Tax=Ischnura elegans TaxID=197161 RepID=UPI001ED8B185|nr:uncharacterized protein LOC124155522 isoform X2 [Ischnura elegans]
MKMKVAKDTLICPTSTGGVKNNDCLSGLHVPVDQEMVENMTMPQTDRPGGSINHAPDGVVRLEEVDSNAVTAMLWPSDGILRQTLLSPALLAFAYPGHEKPVKDMDMVMKGVSTCNSGLVQVLSLSPGESAKETLCQTVEGLTASQDLRTPLLSHSSASQAPFYSSSPSTPEAIAAKKRKCVGDPQSPADPAISLPPITELTSSHMLVAVNELNLQRLQRSVSGKHKSEHDEIDHNAGSPSRSCVFSPHSDCSPLSQQHHGPQSLLTSELMLVSSDSSGIHHDHIHDHDENLADDSPSNSGLLSHLPSREAVLPAISGSQVSSVLSALADGASVDSTSANEDVDIGQEDRHHSPHMCVSVSSPITRDALPVFSQLKDSSNSSQCSGSQKLQGDEGDQIVDPLHQSSRSDLLSLHGVKCEPSSVMLGHISSSSSSQSLSETSNVPLEIISSSSKHSRLSPSLKEKPESSHYRIASNFSSCKTPTDDSNGKKKHSINHKKPHNSDKFPSQGHPLSKLSRQRRKTVQSKNLPQQSAKCSAQEPVIKPLRNNDADVSLVEEVACFKCRFCPFLSLDKMGVTNHIQENHSTEIPSKSGCAFPDSDGADARDWNNHFKRRRLKCPGCPNVFFSSNPLEVHLSQDHQVSSAELQIILKSMEIESPASSVTITSHKSSQLKEEKLVNRNGRENDSKSAEVSPAEVVEVVESDPFRKRKCSNKRHPKESKAVKELSESSVNELDTYIDQQGKVSYNKQQVGNSLVYERENCDEETQPRPPSVMGLLSVETALEATEEDDDEEGRASSGGERDYVNDSEKKSVGTDPLPVTSRSTPKRRGRPRGSRNSGITALRRLNPSVRLGEKELGYCCGIDGCAVRMRSLDNIEYHRRCHVVGGGSANGGMQHVCPECGELFSHWRSVGVHLWRAHVIDMELYSCDQCTYKTNSYSKLMNLHKRIHSSERPFLCDACGKGFKTSKQLRNHKTIHLVKLKQRIMHCGECEVCHRSFSDRRMLRLHRDTVHHKLRPYLCNFCGYAASSRSTLKMHMRQHTGEKPFQCDACDYRTADHNTLRRHKMRHSGEKPYKCPYCSYACIQSSTYKTHLKNKHPGQDDGLMFSCHLCSFRSIKKENYITHMADHEHGAIPATGNIGVKRSHRTNGETADCSSTEKTAKTSTSQRSKKKNDKSLNKGAAPNSKKGNKMASNVELDKTSKLVLVEEHLSEICNNDSEGSALQVESDLDPLRTPLDEGPIILSVHSAPSIEDSKEIIIPDRSPLLNHQGDSLSESQQQHFMYSSSLEGIIQQIPMHHLSNVVVSPWQAYIPGPHSRNASCENDPDGKEDEVTLEPESALSSNGDTITSSHNILFPSDGSANIRPNMSASYPISNTSNSSSLSSSDVVHFSKSQQQMMKLAMGQIQHGSVIRVVEHLCSSPSPVVTNDAASLASSGLLRSPTQEESITISHMSMAHRDENASEHIRGDVLVTTEVCDDEEELKYKVTNELREIS